MKDMHSLNINLGERVGSGSLGNLMESFMNEASCGFWRTVISEIKGRSLSKRWDRKWVTIFSRKCPKTLNIVWWLHRDCGGIWGFYTLI